MSAAAPWPRLGLASAFLSFVLFRLSIYILPPGFKVGGRFRPRFAAVRLLVGVNLFFSADIRCTTDETGTNQRIRGQQPLSIKLNFDNCRFDEGKLCLTSEAPLGPHPTATLNWVDVKLQEWAEQRVVHHLALRNDPPQIDTLPVYFKVISVETITPPNSPTHAIAYAEIDTQRVSAKIDKIIDDLIFSGSGPDWRQSTQCHLPRCSNCLHYKPTPCPRRLAGRVNSIKPLSDDIFSLHFGDRFSLRFWRGLGSAMESRKARSDWRLFHGARASHRPQYLMFPTGTG